jgi:hypothetical protein
MTVTRWGDPAIPFVSGQDEAAVNSQFIVFVFNKAKLPAAIAMRLAARRKERTETGAEYAGSNELPVLIQPITVQIPRL